MRILSIDSSLGSQLLVCDAPEAQGAAAAPLEVSVLSHQEQADSRHHAESLGPMLAAALEEAGSALDLVVAATGPAPFTGLRAGLVTARTVARARGLEVLGVPSLDAVARAALDELAPGERADARVLVLTDARRKEVYAAVYRAAGPDDVERAGDFEVLAPAAVAERLADGGAWAGVTHVAGSGALLYPQAAGGRPVLAPVSGDALAQVRLALTRRATGVEQGAEPLYLRHADVQMPTRTKRHQ